MELLTPLDLGIIGGLVLLLLGLGLSAGYRRDTMSLLAAGRQLTLPAFVVTLVCTWYGGILGIGESVAWYGAGTWLLLGVPYYVFGLIYAFVLAKRVREAEPISIPERMAEAWGKGPATVAGSLLFLLGIPAAHVLMLAVLIQVATGWAIGPAVGVAALVVGVLAIRGGLMADVRVSVAAFALMYIGFAVAAFRLMQSQPLPEMWSGLGPAFQTINGGQGPFTIVSFFLLGAWTLADPGFHQRVASARTPQVSQRGVIVAVLCWMVFDFLSMITGLYALGLVQVDNPLLIFPALAEAALLPGIRGLFVIGILGTVLSAGVGYTIVSGASVGREVVSRLQAKYEETQTSRWGMVVALALAGVVALNLQSVVAIWYEWAGLVVGAMLFPTLVAYLWPQHGSARGQTIAMAASFLVVGTIWGIEKSRGAPILTFQSGEEQVFLGTLIPAAVISGLCVLADRWIHPHVRN